MVVHLKDLTSKITKGTTPSNIGETFSDSGVMYFRSELIGKSKYVDKSHGLLYITESVHQKLKRSHIQKGDMLFSMAGVYLGKISLVGEGDYPANTNQAVAIIRLIPGKCDTDYLYYYMTQKSFNEYVCSLCAQAAQPNINLEQIGKLKVNLPSLSTQQKIATILSAYDSHIENNKKRIKCLEDTISLLFKKCFVWGDKKGWEAKRLGEIIYQRKSKLNSWGDMDIVDLSSMPSYSMTLQSYSNPEDFTTNIFKLDKMDLLFGAIRPYLGKAGFAPKDCAVAGTVLNFKVKENLYYYYTLALITSKYFFDYANCVASGTKMPVIKFEDICRYTISIPLEKTIFQSFNKIVAPLVEELNSLSVQNANLVHQRDLLLPRLMSGKLGI